MIGVSSSCSWDRSEGDEATERREVEKKRVRERSKKEEESGMAIENGSNNLTITERVDDIQQ